MVASVPQREQHIHLIFENKINNFKNTREDNPVAWESSLLPPQVHDNNSPTEFHPVVPLIPSIIIS